MRRIAFYMPDLRAGGAQRVMLRVASYLRRDPDLTVDVIVNRGGGPLAASVDPGLRVHELGAKRIRSAVPPLVRYLRRHRPDAMMCTLLGCMWTAALAVPIARTRTGLIFRQANLFGPRYVTEGSSETLSARVGYRLLPWLLRRADAVLTVSESVRCQVVAAGVPETDVHFVPNPLVAADIDERARAAVDHPWFVDREEVPVIVAAGRLNDQKGFDVLIRAVGILNQSRAVRAIILGNGPQRAELEALRDTLGLTERVDLPGIVENPFPWFARASAFVSSSRWEGMPNVVLEALASGCALVCTDCPGESRRIIEVAGGGELVATDDVAGMAGAIERVIDRPEDYPINEETMERQFGIASVAEQYLGLLAGTVPGVKERSAQPASRET